MEMNEKQASGGYMQAPILDKTVTSEISGDFTLPDYQPDIKRLLRVTASVLPPATYVGNHQAEFEGSVDYYVLYTGSDNEVYCAPLSADYKVNIPIDPREEEGLLNLTADASVTADMVSGRVISPKKLNIKCRLRTRSTVYGELAMEDGFESDACDTELLGGTARVMRASFGVGERVGVTDEMIIDNRDGEVRVIAGEGNALISEVTATDSSVACRGDLYLKLLMCRENGDAPYAVMRKLPFSGNVAVENARTGGSAMAKASVCDMSITVEDGRILTEVGLLCEVYCCVEEDVYYVKDMYSTCRRTECEYRAVEVLGKGIASCGNFTLSDSVTLEEAGIGQGAVLIDAVGVAIPEEYHFESDKCMVEGRARFSVLYQKEGEYAVSEVEMPFRYELKTQGEMSRATVETRVVSVRTRMDGERLGIDAEIGVCGFVRQMKEEKMLDSVSFGEEIGRSKGDFVICYPAKDDSVWSVAKRYGTPLKRVIENNGLSLDMASDSADSLNGVHHLTV